MPQSAHGPVRAIVESVEELSPGFRRIIFSGRELNYLATDGPFYDQRIKLIFPAASGLLPTIPEGPDWYRDWLALPDAERGTMRTYSVRELTRENDITRLTVDFVLHFGPDGTGPASEWAATAEQDEELLVVAPRRGAERGGIEFAPGRASEVVLLGDETAVPAIARILGDLRDQGAAVDGAAYLEVPTTADQLDIEAPDSFRVHWLPREGAEPGARLAESLGWHCAEDEPAEESVSGDLVWETPGYSESGEELSTSSEPATGTYYWIAGESSVIKQLRRFLVREKGVERAQVAFMGYWRQGVAMRG